MNEEKVREILGDMILDDGGLYSLGKYLSWHVGESDLVLDGDFDIDELEAIVWWVKHHTAPAR